MSNSLDRRSFPHSRSRPSRRPRRSRGVGIGLLAITGALVLGDEARSQVGVESDREVLEGFYHATGGPDWFFSTNWLSDEPLSEWRGVQTHDEGRVRGLVLHSNNLNGSLPPDLVGLTRLVDLSFFRNRLSGPIPPELGQLTSLGFLQLPENQLSGPIPPELGRLTNLSFLSLYRNQLSGPIPPELGGLTSLESLLLSRNQLSGPIPPELGQLTNLEILTLWQNQLSGPIPPELGQLTRLESLQLSRNQLSGPIPPELGRLTRLEFLQLSRNQLSGAAPARAGSIDQPRKAVPPPQPVERADSGRAREPHRADQSVDRQRCRALSAARDPGHGVRRTGARRGCPLVRRGDGTPAGDVVGASARPRRVARAAPEWHRAAAGRVMTARRR